MRSLRCGVDYSALTTGHMPLAAPLMTSSITVTASVKRNKCAKRAHRAALGTHGLKAALLIETVSSIAVISTQVGAAILPITIHDSHTLLSPNSNVMVSLAIKRSRTYFGREAFRMKISNNCHKESVCKFCWMRVCLFITMFTFFADYLGDNRYRQI